MDQNSQLSTPKADIWNPEARWRDKMVNYFSLGHFGVTKVIQCSLKHTLKNVLVLLSDQGRRSEENEMGVRSSLEEKANDCSTDK